MVRRGRERHVHGHLLVGPAAYATVAAAPCRPIVYQQYEKCAMQIHVVTVVISFFLDTFFMAPEGTASGPSHGGVGLRSSCQDSCLREDHVLNSPGRLILAPTFLTVFCGTFATNTVPNLTPCSPDAAREVCRESTRFRQARKHFQPACGRLARAARRCTPRPSRRVAKRTMGQCALTFLGTIAFCLHTFWRTALFFSFSCTHGCFRDLLLDFSRLLGLTLRLFAPVFRCHGEIFATLEAGTCAGSRAWYFFFVLSLVFMDGDVLKRILTAREELPFKGC